MKAIDRVRLTWGGAIVTALLAYGAIVFPERQAVARAEMQAGFLYDTANRNERLIAEEPSLEQARHRAVDDISLLLSFEGAMPVAIGALNHLSTQSGVQVVGLRPGPSLTPNTTLPSGVLTEHDLDIELEGNFLKIATFLSALSNAQPLFGIHSITLQNSENSVATSPTLHATIATALYSLDPHWRESAAHASSAR
jgi:Tfp pilus assembly protein PilO